MSFEKDLAKRILLKQSLHLVLSIHVLMNGRERGQLSLRRLYYLHRAILFLLRTGLTFLGFHPRPSKQLIKVSKGI